MAEFHLSNEVNLSVPYQAFLRNNDFVMIDASRLHALAILGLGCQIDAEIMDLADR